MPTRPNIEIVVVGPGPIASINFIGCPQFPSIVIGPIHDMAKFGDTNDFLVLHVFISRTRECRLVRLAIIVSNAFTHCLPIEEVFVETGREMVIVIHPRRIVLLVVTQAEV